VKNIAIGMGGLSDNGGCGIDRCSFSHNSAISRKFIANVLAQRSPANAAFCLLGRDFSKIVPQASRSGLMSKNPSAAFVKTPDTRRAVVQDRNIDAILSRQTASLFP